MIRCLLSSNVNSPLQRRPFAARLRSLRISLALAGILLFGSLAIATAAGPVYWDYPETFPFRAFDLDGVALDRYGRLEAGLAHTELLAGGPDIVWRTIDDGDGGVFVATGHGGEIWHVGRDGEPKLFAKLPEPEIFSLLLIGDHLFAGGGPDGLLYRLATDGEAETETWADLTEGYIWGLCAGPDGEVYAAVGSPGAVYRVDDRLEATRLAVLPAANALDVELAGNGELWVATQGPGLIYRIDADKAGAMQVIYETPQEEVRQFARGPEGGLYALAVSRQVSAGGISLAVPGNSSEGGPANGQPGNGQEQPTGKAAVYRLEPDGLATRVWNGQAELMAIAYSRSWGWLGAGLLEGDKKKAALLVLEPPKMTQPVATFDAGDALHLLIRDDKSDREQIVISLAHPSRVLRLEDRPADEAIAVSQPLDGLMPVRWGRLRWEGSTPKGGKLLWSVRGGSRSVPDETWTDWSDSWQDQDHEIPLPPTRFLQWRVQFDGDKRGATVGNVTVSGFEPNLAPEIFEFSLQADGEINMGGLMSREENITETFRNGLKAEYSVSSRDKRRASLFRAAPARPLRTFVWQAGDPNDDRLSFRLEYQRLGQKTWRPVGPETGEQLGSWDTTAVPDGLYVVRLTASDRPDNPRAQALEAKRLSAPIHVDHTAPKIGKFEARRTEAGVEVSFEAADAGSPLAEAWIELPDGTSERLDPLDGVCDSQKESFSARVAFPEPGKTAPPEPWRIRVEVADRLGNAASEEGEAVR